MPAELSREAGGTRSSALNAEGKRGRVALQELPENDTPGQSQSEMQASSSRKTASLT